ncbi:MAG: 30S ribosomal protein S17 [Gemmatimonadota bacterium]
MSEGAQGNETDRDAKTRIGTVVSDKMDKTVVVSVERQYPHPLYEKRVSRHSKFYAHDEENECRTGDVVLIEETRPLSKKKRWRFRELIERPAAEQVEGTVTTAEEMDEA